jgi:hypothetical protein
MDARTAKPYSAAERKAAIGRAIDRAAKAGKTKAVAGLRRIDDRAPGPKQRAHAEKLRPRAEKVLVREAAIVADCDRRANERFLMLDEMEAQDGETGAK